MNAQPPSKDDAPSPRRKRLEGRAKAGAPKPEATPPAPSQPPAERHEGKLEHDVDERLHLRWGKAAGAEPKAAAPAKAPQRDPSPPATSGATRASAPAKAPPADADAQPPAAAPKAATPAKGQRDEVRASPPAPAPGPTLQSAPATHSIPAQHEAQHKTPAPKAPGSHTGSDWAPPPPAPAQAAPPPAAATPADADLFSPGKTTAQQPGRAAALAARKAVAPAAAPAAPQAGEPADAKRGLFRPRPVEPIEMLERDGSARTPAVASPRMKLPPGGAVASIPPVPPGHSQVDLTVVVPERAWVRILYDEAAHTYLYEVIEPQLSAEEVRVRVFLHDTLVRTLDGRQGRDHDWEAVLVASIRQAIIDHSIRITEAGARRLEYYLVRDFLGYGPIDILMRDPMLEDISCDGPQIPLYLFHRKYESVRTNVQFADEQELDSFVIRLAQRSRKHISIADPLLDATLPDGSRLQCTLSREVTTRGSSFTIRKFRADPMTPPDLIRYGTLSAEMAGWFWFAMEVGSSFLLAGGTASGKTTTLNAVSQFIPPEKKIVSIEDTREINLSHENWIAGVTRSGFGGELIGGKIAGTIDMYKLLEAALRQRPEYLLVGEVRGPEALTLFQAMATGHAVYSTMHADSVQSAVYRLENEPINVPRMMLQTLDIMAIQAQVRIGEKSARRLTEVTEIVGYEPETRELLTNTVFEWNPQTNEHRYLGKSYVLEQVMEARNLTEEQVDAEWRARVEVLDWMMKHDVRKVANVAAVVSQYYRNPSALLERIRSGAPPAALGVAAAAKEAARGPQ